MKTRKRTGLVSWFLCGILAVSCSFFACSTKQSGKNLIYIIGDGMGFAHIENTALYMDAEKLGFEDYYVGEVTTRSADAAVTDSAAGATALATGVKTNNGFVGLNPDGENLENLMEISKKAGKRTGVVTTDTLDGATPAGFSAHTDSRNDRNGIIAGQVSGSVDLLLGKFSAYYVPAQEDFVASGFAYGDSLDGLKELSKSSKIIGNIRDVEPTYGKIDPSDYVPLKAMVEYSLDFLTKKNKVGFTLMVEGAYIDKHSHSNEIQDMIYAMMDLNDAVTYILEWASKRTDTTVIITADHETGGLQTATSKDALGNSLYTSTSHTATNVPLYLYNARTELTAFDNTDVFQIAKAIAES